MTPTEARNLATSTGETDTDAALALARAIEDPWFATQALAWIGWHAQATRFLEIEREALTRCAAADDPYTTVEVAAWPIAALIQRERKNEAMGAAEDALRRAPEIAHPVRRGHALFTLWQAMFPLGEQALSPLTEAVQAAHNEGQSWRCGCDLRRMALMLARHSPAAARRILASMREDKYKRQAERRLVAQEFEQPFEFFWKRPPRAAR